VHEKVHLKLKSCIPLQQTTLRRHVSRPEDEAADGVQRMRSPMEVRGRCGLLISIQCFCVEFLCSWMNKLHNRRVVLWL
jgi:hypothetical protein